MPPFASLSAADLKNLATFLNGLGTTYK
jgi:hypothetical protein